MKIVGENPHKRRPRPRVWREKRERNLYPMLPRWWYVCSLMKASGVLEVVLEDLDDPWRCSWWIMKIALRCSWWIMKIALRCSWGFMKIALRCSWGYEDCLKEMFLLKEIALRIWDDTWEKSQICMDVCVGFSAEDREKEG